MDLLIFKWPAYSVSQKIPPAFFWPFPPNGWEFFSPNFTRLLHIPTYARLQIFIQLPATPNRTEDAAQRTEPEPNFHFSVAGKNPNRKNPDIW